MRSRSSASCGTCCGSTDVEKPLDRETRDRLIDTYLTGRQAFEERAKEKGTFEEETRRLRATAEGALRAYFRALPLVPMSRCPICRTRFAHCFDLFGFSGFWWHEDLQPSKLRSQACAHFGVLQGAVRLARDANVRIRWVTGKEKYIVEARIGPDAPFVIPRVLDQPGIVAVVSSIEMKDGHLAFPVVYFIQGPLRGHLLTHAWRQVSYGWSEGGGHAWRVDTDPWDFDLEPWIQRDKLLWIEPGDARWQLRTSRSRKRCPFLGLDGPRQEQFVTGKGVVRLPTPDNEEVDPFSG